jgi:predicted Ser/Thr protein kinase
MLHLWLLLLLLGASGLLLGVGSFGRVYKGAWRGMEVAVKVLHHDSNTAAAVANEVDLVMSFK